MRDENEYHQNMHSVDNASEDQVAWVNQQGSGENESMTSGSDDYMVMWIKKKNVTELKIPGARVQVNVSGKKMWLWVDSGSPVTIFSLTDLKATGVKLIFSYNHLKKNSWTTITTEYTYLRHIQSTLGRDLRKKVLQRKKVM